MYVMNIILLKSDGFIVLTSINTYARVEQCVYALLRTRDMSLTLQGVWDPS
jgi:hypothetical protein